MKKLNASSAFMFSLLAVIGLAMFSSYHFFNEMNGKSILIASGNEPVHRILDHYKYQKSKKGLIFSMTFLLAASSFFVMILLPSEDRQPVRRPVTPREPLREEPREAATPVRAESSISTSVAQLGSEEEPVQVPAERTKTTRESAIEAIEELDLEDVDFSQEMEITEGEDDVVYGGGEITAPALMDFVHKYPDSALKFLFRRKLDGKPLGQDEEDIYAGWERRGLTRGKIKRYILQLMEWEEIPKEPLYEIWKKIRDHIFENYGA